MKIIIVFLSMIFGFSFANLFTTDSEYSESERRNLASFEIPTIETMISGEWFSSFQEYSTDQFVLREEFRTLNALTRLEIYKQSDIGGIYVDDGYIFKASYPINFNTINHFINKTNEIYETYLKDVVANYYVSVVPDKSYYSDKEDLNIDDKEVADLFVTELTDAKYIDIFGALSLDSYYKTDTHWSQDKLFEAMEVFANSMGFDAPDKDDYIENVLSDFYGVYYGQSALDLDPDELIYMTNEIINQSTIYIAEKNSYDSVYNENNFESKDPYNVFTGGSAALVVIESPLAKTDKELVIFRDSFGSSISPLFLEEYSKITLVDLRYFGSSLLEQYVDFEGVDVLVLYSSLVLNSEVRLK